MRHCYFFLVFFFLSLSCLQADETWFESDYLLWRIKDSPISIPLVTSASLEDPVPGALGQPGTKVLMGDKNGDWKWRNGFRVTVGKWIDCPSQIGLEGSFFMLPKTWHRQSVSTSGEVGSKNVAVPIYDVTGLWGLNGVPGETVFILPGPLFGPGFRGHFSLHISNLLQGFELNSLINLPRFNVSFIGGFRWLQLEESLLFTGRTAALPNSSLSGFYNFKDIFKVNNNFYGFQIGVKTKYDINNWIFKGFAKVAVGCMHQTLKIKGRSQTSNGNLFYMTNNSGGAVLDGGIFAEPTNQGTYRWNEFAAVLESGVNLSYPIFSCLEVGVGYNFMWFNKALRPGKQIDRKINPTRTALAAESRETVGVGPDTPIPFGSAAAASLPRGSEHPKVKHRSSDFWVHGLAVNLTLHF